MKSILVVIPARGGSKGIPRKNLRLLNNKPLIYYSIKLALSSKFHPDVYVSSDDDEILLLAEKFGAKIHKRSPDLSKDEITLDPVIYNCYEYAKNIENKEYELIVTLQPTSPLLKVESLDNAIKKLLDNPDIDTIISATEDTHLTWRKVGSSFIPNYERRVNRQYLPKIYKETGGFLITRNNIISLENRIGKNVDLYILNIPESIDIDTYEDWNLCEYFLKRKKILFVVTGNEKLGLGHVYNTLILANSIMNHEITFLVDKNSKLAFEKIKSKNYPVFMQEESNIINDIKKFNPDIVINDILDTNLDYIESLKKLGIKVINFEDLGEGAKKADLVINAIYPEKNVLPNHYFGPEYFLLRDEFIYSPQKRITKEVENVLITFGGVDPNNYTKKVIDSIYNYCKENNIKITVITGFGYNKYESLEVYDDIDIKKDVKNISKYMLEADIIFSSAGRTIYEIASIAVPAIILAQNERELTHFFASSKYGFLNLGLGYKISGNEILEKFKEIVENYYIRLYMSNLMKNVDLKKGRKKVLKLIQDIIEEE